MGQARSIGSLLLTQFMRSQSHRIALVLYLTELKMDDDEEQMRPEQPAASAEVCTEAAEAPPQQQQKQ